MSNIFSLQGINIAIIGGSRGIGLHLSNGLSDLSANILVASRSNRPQELNRDIKYIKTDITNIDQIHELKESVISTLGNLNAIINVAGISLASDSEESENLRFYKTVETNLIAVYNVTTTLLPILTGKNASIVNITSINSTLGFPNNPGYVASKSALSGLTRAMAVDFSKYQIRANSIAPGYFHTRMTSASYLDSVKQEERAKKTVLGRWGELSELVGPVAFLISPAATYITGVEIPVDGGWSIKGL
jgi:NAD(P)-dependent dehydrogenase (short-subunit alcohol dehydrogenase family)